MELKQIQFSAGHNSISIKTDHFEVTISDKSVGVAVFNVKDKDHPYLSKYEVAIHEGKESYVQFIPHSSQVFSSAVQGETRVVTLNIEERK